MSTAAWPYLQTLARLLLALAVGLFVGLERERRGKEAGLRTFAFASLIGCLGGLLGESYSLLSLALVALLVVFLNVQGLRAEGEAELTTSAALLVTAYAGLLCGLGHTLTPAAVAVVTAAMLAWKRPLSGFTLGLSEVELRSAILLGILACVIYPALPEGTIDPWGAVAPRTAWLTVILIAGMGFINYVLWRLYGSRGFEISGLLGGLVNSTVAVSELSARVRETNGQLMEPAYRGILLATGAMLLRNGILLAVLGPPAAFSTALPPLVAMLAMCAVFALPGWRRAETSADEAPPLKLKSPFSLKSALRFGVIFLLLQVAGVISQREFGQFGVYVVSLLGGLFSSASAVASAATLAAAGTISNRVAGHAALIASFGSVIVNLPLVLRAGEHRLIRRVGVVLGLIVCVGIGVALASAALRNWL